MGLLGTIKHSWNAFLNQPAPIDPLRPFDFRTEYSSSGYGGSPSRLRLKVSNERSLIASIYTRIGIDVATTEIRHVRLDEAKRYLDDMESGLNECLMVEANIDQGPSQFIQDAAMTLCDEGIIAIVPVDTTLDPTKSSSFEIKTLRVGRIVEWKPEHVKVDLYNQRNGRREQVWLEKRFCAIVENPLYSVMNEPNSTLQRIIHKLNLLDAIDEQSSSGKLDLIIQLPYVVKTEAKRLQAEQRRKDIEFQLKGSKYGIAYADGTEKITQLNRPAENNLMGQIEYLMKMLYGQLGLTEEIMNGTANEEAMLNYNARTVEPIVRAIVEAMRRSFLTKTARSQRQSIMYFRDPFKLVPISQIAEIADKFARNEITSSNEIRQAIGLRPSKDPKADQLMNSNMPQPNGGVIEGEVVPTAEIESGSNSELDMLEGEVDELLRELEQ